MSGRYQINIQPAAMKAIEDVRGPRRADIIAAIDALEASPRPQGHEKLSGYTNLYRVRVGDFRIVYAIDDGVLTVLVVLVGHRRDIYEAVQRFMRHKGKAVEVKPPGVAKAAKKKR